MVKVPPGTPSRSAKGAGVLDACRLTLPDLNVDAALASVHETMYCVERKSYVLQTFVVLAVALSLVARADASTLAPGLYAVSGQAMYVGVEHELPDPASNDFFDPASQRTGDLHLTHDLHLRSGISEERRVIEAPQGRLGFSLYYLGNKPRATVILIHGNDPETREMGFIVPFFVCNGINVISYDQRGVGESAGNWFLNGPSQRAGDVAAIYDAMRSDAHVDTRRIGVWGFSNGGWTAPLVALHRPVAFMILKSAPTESLAQNIDYEVEEQMRRHGVEAASPQAVALWHAFEGALDGSVSWNYAKRLYDVDAKRSWFRYSLMSGLGFSIPPPPSMIAGLRRLVTFDPTHTLLSLSSTPVLALYGALDRNVDASDSATHLRAYLARAEDRDVTIKTYPNAGHQLIVSKSGYNGDATLPERFVPGYPQIVIAWLAHRGFVRPVTEAGPDMSRIFWDQERL
jgi:pimeloyl-ACP methyl ester carboxylesterase